MVKKILFIIGSALLFALMLTILELNKNTVAGSIITILVSVGFWVVYALVLSKSNGCIKLLGWFCWIAAFVAILFITWPPVKAVPAVNYKNPVKTDVITLKQGQIRGVITEDGAVEIYTGIPYAKAPVGELRWKEPQDHDGWEGILEADHFAPMSMQPTNLPIYDSLARIIGYHDYKISFDDNYTAPVSEDSLYLNVWKPKGDVSDLPVLVYIHGGSLQTGQPWYDDYGGEALARQNAVVVNMGYRLGVFGFFADEKLAAESPNGTTGNYGLLDQIKALEWVRDNISAFGGDPDNVTLAGESAGSACVSALCTSPLAKGLFKRVLLESSTVASVKPPHSFRDYDTAILDGKEMKARYGKTYKYGFISLDELRALPAEKIVKEATTQHHITIDGYALTETPYESYKKGVYNEESIIHGYNLEESAAFIIFAHANMKNYESKVRGYFGKYADDVLALYPAKTDAEASAYWAEMFGAAFFDYPHYCLNRLAVENGIDVYEYTFTKKNGRLGAWHSGEEVYFYGNIPSDSTLYDSRDRELMSQMNKYLRNYMENGDPNGEALPVWEENLSSYDLMEFGNTTSMTKERKPKLYEILDKLTEWNEN